MIIFASCFTLQQVMLANEGCTQNVGLNRSLVSKMFPHPRALPYMGKTNQIFCSVN